MSNPKNYKSDKVNVNTSKLQMVKHVRGKTPEWTVDIPISSFFPAASLLPYVRNTQLNNFWHSGLYSLVLTISNTRCPLSRVVVDSP